MKYTDISTFNFNPYDLKKNIESIKNLGVIAPDSVIEQFYLDHHADNRFRSLYGNLLLNKLHWELKEFPISFFEKNWF